MTAKIRAQFELLPIEEVANTITHGFGLILSIIGFVVLLVFAGYNGDRWSLVGCVVYGTSLVVLYAASTFYHSSTEPQIKKNLQIVDHCCIYLLIAGTYTPFSLVVAGQTGSNLLLIGIWAFAIIGILLKLIFKARYPAISVISYVVMGWLGVFALEPLLNALGSWAVALTVAGGVAYTLGVVFFPWKSIRHHHAIFHVFILLGSIIHYAAILLYVVPYTVNL